MPMAIRQITLKIPTGLPPAMPLLQRLGDPDLMGRLDVQSMFKEAYNMTEQFAQVIAYSSAAASLPEEKEEE
jgi:hypothetical protein